MNKTYKVRNYKKHPQIFTPVANVAEYIDCLEAHGDKSIFVWKENNERREISYSDFAALVRNFSVGLNETFGKEPKVYAIVSEMSPYWVASYLAVIASGNLVVPMDKELDPAEISKFLAIANVHGVIYSKSFTEVFDTMLTNGHETVKYRIPIDADSYIGVSDEFIVPFDRIVKLGQVSETEFIPDTDAERCCEYLFTSGTTGTSKCVMLSQKNVFSTMTSGCEVVNVNKDDVLISVLPPHHTYALCGTLAACDFGCTVCINDSLRHLMKDFNEYKPTCMVLVPLFITTMYKRVMSEAKRSGKDKALLAAAKVSHYLEFLGVDMSEKVFKDVREAFGGRLEKLLCGGAPLNPEMIPLFESFGISIYEGYGITECSPLVAITPYTKRKPGSPGTVLSCCEMRIDGMQTNDLGYVTGEIQVRGDNVMLGYLGNDEANAAAFTDDGWFRTGDLGYIDRDGYLFISGRSKSVIVLDNGKNVSPEEIEEYLEKIDMIAESVVVGRGDEDDSTKLVAVVFPNYEKYPDMSENDIRVAIRESITALNKKMPSFKQIHKLEFRKTEFEKTTTKKIKRHLVK